MVVFVTRTTTLDTLFPWYVTDDWVNDESDGVEKKAVCFFFQTFVSEFAWKDWES